MLSPKWKQKSLCILIPFLVACGDDECPVGSTATGHTCLPDAPVDAGGDTGPDVTMLDTGTDAPDAGPCPDGCGGTTPMCDTVNNRCVACLGHEQCADADMARCDSDTGMCAPCDDGAQCAGVPGDPTVCSADNRCVECTTDNVSRCGENVCTSENVCSVFGTAQTECQPCHTDENCEGEMYFCVPMTFGEDERDTGFCLKKTPGCTQPFITIITGRTSISGVTGQSYSAVNEAMTTCEAVLALENNVMCPGGVDSECPLGGRCETLDPGVGDAENRCTYDCSGPIECPLTPSISSTCADRPATGADYCGG